MAANLILIEQPCLIKQLVDHLAKWNTTNNHMDPIYTYLYILAMHMYTLAIKAKATQLVT